MAKRPGLPILERPHAPGNGRLGSPISKSLKKLNQDRLYLSLIIFFVYLDHNFLSITVNKKRPSLLFCILMDLVGSATYALPFLGEFADLIWAPVSAFIFYRTFGGWKGSFGGVFNFVEELLPGFDFIPTFTITWLWQYLFKKKTKPFIKLSPG